MLYELFWVIPRRLNFICRRFGKLSLFHLHRQIGVCVWNELGLRNVGLYTGKGLAIFRAKILFTKKRGNKAYLVNLIL
jgi:hypothetical protein